MRLRGRSYTQLARTISLNVEVAAQGGVALLRSQLQIIIGCLLRFHSFVPDLSCRLCPINLLVHCVLRCIDLLKDGLPIPCPLTIFHLTFLIIGLDIHVECLMDVLHFLQGPIKIDTLCVMSRDKADFVGAARLLDDSLRHLLLLIFLDLLRDLLLLERLHWGEIHWWWSHYD